MSAAAVPASSVVAALAGALLSLVVPMHAHAQAQESAGTVFSLAGLYDEDGTYAVNAGLDHAFGQATWLRLTAGLADGATGPVGLSTYRAGVGLDHWFDPAGLAVDVEYWGDSDTIETLTYKGELYFRGEHARFGLNAAFRDIDIKYQVPAVARNLVDDGQSFTATGFGASYRYTWDALSLYATATGWSYDEPIGTVVTNVNLSRVPLLLRPAVQQRLATVVNAVRFLSASSLTLANSLLAQSASAGFDYRFGEKSLNVELAHDRGEVDDLDVNTLSAGWLFPVGSAGDVELRVGVSDADTFGTTVFGGISLFLYR
jgi:hypothetical protein